MMERKYVVSKHALHCSGLVIFRWLITAFTAYLIYITPDGVSTTRIPASFMDCENLFQTHILGVLISKTLFVSMKMKITAPK